MIPKIIWQTNEANLGNMPREIQESVNFLRNNAIGWDHRYLDKAQRKSIVKDNKTLYRMYIHIDKIFQSAEIRANQVNVCGKWRDYRYAKGMFRSDIFKLIVLYEFGGLYLDSDMLPTQKSIELLSNTDYDLYANIHAKTCSHCFMPLRESNNPDFQLTKIEYPYSECSYAKTNKHFFNTYGIDAIAVKPKSDILEEIIQEILAQDSIVFLQQIYTEKITRLLSEKSERVNEELDVIEFERLKDKAILPIQSDKFKVLAEEEKIVCSCIKEYQQ